MCRSTVFSSDLKTQALTILHEMTHLFLETEDFDFSSNTSENIFFQGAEEKYKDQTKGLYCAYPL